MGSREAAIAAELGIAEDAVVPQGPRMTPADPDPDDVCRSCGGRLTDGDDGRLCGSCRYLDDRGWLDAAVDADPPPAPDDPGPDADDADPDDPAPEIGPLADETAAETHSDDEPDRSPPDEGQLSLGADWGVVEKPPYEIPPTSEIEARGGTNGHCLVSTFSGCGGTSAGFRWAGFDVLWASEFVEAARKTYEANWPSTPVDGRDIREVDGAEILAQIGLERGDVDVLEGGPPCAAFSMAGKREHHLEGGGQETAFEGYTAPCVDCGEPVDVPEPSDDDDDDDRDEVRCAACQSSSAKTYSDVEQRVDDLFYEFKRLVDELHPRVFLIENVPSLTTGSAEPVFRRVMRLLRESGDDGYIVDARVLDASRHGTPQRRQRLFIQGVRRDVAAAAGVRPAYPRDLRYQYTIRDAIPWIGDNARIEWDEKSFKAGDDPASTDEPSPTMMAGGMGGVAHHQARLAEYDGVAWVPDDDQEVGNDIRAYAIGREWLNLEPGEQSEKYFNLIRPDPDDPCPTVTQTGGCHGAASVAHPHEPRKFTIPELRRLCGFPDDFVLTGSYRQRWERLGRAVPPPLSRRLAEAIRDEILDPAKEATDG